MERRKLRHRSHLHDQENGQTETSKGTVTLTDNTGTLDAKLDEPGSLLVDVKVKSADDKPHQALGGALIAPDKITPASPRPDDFDQFWSGKLKELAAIPPNAQLEPAEAASQTSTTGKSRSTTSMARTFTANWLAPKTATNSPPFSFRNGPASIRCKNPGSPIAPPKAGWS